MLNTKQAAEHVGLAPFTMAKMRCYGGGPAFFKIGAAVRYAPEALDAWLETKRRTSTSQA